MYVDFHTHIDFFKENELLKVFDDINKNDIKVVSCSMDLETYKQNIEFSKICSNIIPTFGIHPWSVKSDKLIDDKSLDYKLFDLEIYDDYIKNTKIIGEVGLDFHWVEDKSTFPNQIKVFEYFVKKAKDYNKYLNIHTKGAEELIYDILKREDILDRSIIHWYSGDFDTFKKFLDADSMFTIGVDIHTSEKTKEFAKLIPTERLLCETDGPTALEWVNGIYGMPCEIINVYKSVCDVKNICEDELHYFIDKNYKNIIL